jgi:hypothetical protein
MAPTQRHGWDRPAPGDQDWGVTLNALLQDVDGDVPEWEPAADRPSSPSVAGAGYIETDTGDVYLGSGDASSWTKIGTIAPFDPQTIDQASDLGFAVSTDAERTAHAGTADAHHPVASVTAQSAAYTASVGDFVLADASGGAFTVTLPAPSTDAIVGCKKVDSSSNAVTVSQNGSETIDGATTQSLGTQYDVLEVISDGTDWFIR